VKPKSPCNKVCRVRDGVCEGCFRTIDDIKNWSRMSTSECYDAINNANRRKEGMKK
jgi:predicted Fe-S protein YdhL (DUF1289 family)